MNLMRHIPGDIVLGVEGPFLLSSYAGVHYLTDQPTHTGSQPLVLLGGSWVSELTIQPTTRGMGYLLSG
jgi:hypothetical protein